MGICRIFFCIFILAVHIFCSLITAMDKTDGSDDTWQLYVKGVA